MQAHCAMSTEKFFIGKKEVTKVSKKRKVWGEGKAEKE